MLLDGHLEKVVSGEGGSKTVFMSQRERVHVSGETNNQNKHKLMPVATPSLNPLPPGDPSQRTDRETGSRPMASSQARQGQWAAAHYIQPIIVDMTRIKMKILEAFDFFGILFTFHPCGWL